MDNTTPPSSCATAVATETVVGSHVLTIDGFSKTTAALAVGESIRSEQFRVGGHRWYIECCPRREDEEGTEWVSVLLRFDLDGALEDEVKARPFFILQDRAGETIRSCFRHVQTFSTKTDLACGTDEFIQRKALESYLLIQDDDCCRIRCDVTVIREPPVVRPPSDLGDLLLASEVGRDVTFVVDEALFTAHSCVLAARSSTAFMAEVLAGMERAGTRHVRVDGMDSSVFGALLHFIYTDSLPNNVQDEEEDFDFRIGLASGLLEAAHRYNMDRLKVICTNVLRSNIYAGTALFTLQQSHEHQCLELNRACVEFIRNRLDAFNLEKTNRWLQPGTDKLT